MITLNNKNVKQLRVTSYYTGSLGSYISVMPDASTMDFMKQCCDIAKVSGFVPNSPLNSHVTVVHSKDSLTVEEQGLLLAHGFNPRHEYHAQVSEFTHWEGHNGKGYIVMGLNCAELEAYNSWLRETFNLKTSFDEFKPHITLVEDAYLNGKKRAQLLVDELNWLSFPKNIILTGLKIEDLK